MNKLIFNFILLFFLNNCSFNENSRIWKDKENKLETDKKITINRDNIDVSIDAVADKSVYKQDRKTIRPADREIEGPVSLREMKDAKILLKVKQMNTLA